MPARIADEDLSVTSGCSGNKVFESAESHLAAATIESASVADRRGPVLAAHLEGVPAAQNRKVIDVFKNIVGPIVLRETGAAADAAGKRAQSDIGKTAVRFRRTVAKGNAIVRRASGAGTIRSFKELVKPVVSKPGCVDYR